MKIKDAVYVYRLVGGDRLAWHGRYHAHESSDYEFHFFLEGSGAFMLNKTRYRIEGNRLFLTRPREFHSILPEALEKPITYYAVLFEPDPDDLNDVETLSLINSKGINANRCVSVEARERFLVEELYHLCRGIQDSGQRAAEYLILSLLHRWYGTESTDNSQDNPHKHEHNEHVERALQLMEKSIREKLGSDTMADKLGLSEEHFIRLFRKALGMSPFQYFTRLKIEAASAVLVDSRLPVGAVSEHFGFENPFHFSRVFKKCTGLSPVEYRRTFKSGAEQLFSSQQEE